MSFLSILSNSPTVDHHQSYFSQHLYTAGDLTLPSSVHLSPETTRNFHTENAFRKYFGKKLKTFISGANRKSTPISTYRLKTLKTLKLLSCASMKSPILSLKHLEILSGKSSLSRISGYKNLSSLKLESLISLPKASFFSQMKTLTHLRSLSLHISENLLAKVSRHILELRFLRRLDLEPKDKPFRASEKEKEKAMDLYTRIIKSKTLSYLRLDLRDIAGNLEYMTHFLETLSQTVIPHLQIFLRCPKDCNVDTKCLEAALSKIDLFSVHQYQCHRFQYFVSCSTSQRNVTQAKRKLDLCVRSQGFSQQLRYTPKANESMEKINKDDFDLAESLKLFFCNILDESFSLFKASNIKSIKAIGVNFQPLQADTTTEGIQNLLSIIKNSPSLEHFEMNNVKFDVLQLAPVLEALNNLKQLETLEIRETTFERNLPDPGRKSVLPPSNLKKLILDFKFFQGYATNQKFELPFDLTQLKSLKELTIGFSALKADERENIIKGMRNLSNIEKITTLDLPIFSNERTISNFIEAMHHLNKVKEVYVFSRSEFESDYDKTKMTSKMLYNKVMELLKVNKSIEKFIIKENLCEIKCIRY